MGPTDTAESGFHTDVFEPIHFSGIWRRQTAEAKEDLPFEDYDTNRKKTPTLCLDSSKKLLTPIFVQEIAQAKKRWSKGVAVGRLSVARPDQRACLDSSIPNVRLRKSLANRAWRTSSQTSDGVGLTKDVCKAQKRLRIREDQWRLLLFQRRGELYHFTVCTAGRDSALAWWSRMGGSAHTHLPPVHFHLIFLQHEGWPQAYDFLFRLEAATAPLVAVCTCYFLHLPGCPISWHKIALGRQVRWIGLDMDQLDQTRGT